MCVCVCVMYLYVIGFIPQSQKNDFKGHKAAPKLNKRQTIFTLRSAHTGFSPHLSVLYFSFVPSFTNTTICTHLEIICTAHTHRGQTHFSAEDSRLQQNIIVPHLVFLCYCLFFPLLLSFSRDLSFSLSEHILCSAKEEYMGS